MARIRIAAMVFFVTIIAAFACCWAADDDAPVPLTSGWQYRWGDSPVDANGEFAWLHESSRREWQVLHNLDWRDDRDDREWVWYSIALPSTDWTHPTLYLPNVASSFEVYVGTRRVYQYGYFEPDERNKYTITDVHMVPLPHDYHGAKLFLRVYSSVFVIGFEGTVDPPAIGSQQDLVRNMLWRGVDATALGFLFVFAGFFSLLTFLIRFRENLLAPLSFAFFAIWLGLFYIMGQSSTQFIIESQVLKMYSMALSFLFFPVGLYAYLQFVIYRDAGKTVRRILWVILGVHLGAALVMTVLDIVGAVALPVSMRLYNYLFTVTVPVTIVTTLTLAVRGSTEARIVVWGFVVFGLTGFYDLLQGQQALPFWRWVSQWGALVFVGCLGYVLERDFTDSHRRLQDYSEQLEDKSQQLEEYSHTLEDKVADRTRDLDASNRELRDALKDLKETQQQLVMREKMASLGNLVAGVAHEVNNPIGAVMSAADVSTRCVNIVRDFVNEMATDDSPKVRKAADVLADNNRITSEAARRISEIVKSLKNFARLDEAEFQRVDIHDGIDSTLTLVKHLLKGRIEVVKHYGELPQLLVYPNQLNQVFMNLISNAIDAIEGEGNITITTRRDRLSAYITIADTGPGIPEKQIRRIFDPGFTTKGVGVGTGLGLSISYNIVHKHNGALEVASEPGKGAAFTIVLPLRQISTEQDTPPS